MYVAWLFTCVCEQILPCGLYYAAICVYSSYMWHDSHNEPCHIPTRHVTYEWVMSHEWVMSPINKVRVSKYCHARSTIRAYVHAWHDAFISHLCVTGDVTHSILWHDSFMHETRFNHVCDMTHSCVWHGPFVSYMRQMGRLFCRI